MMAMTTNNSIKVKAREAVRVRLDRTVRPERGWPSRAPAVAGLISSTVFARKCSGLLISQAKTNTRPGVAVSPKAGTRSVAARDLSIHVLVLIQRLKALIHQIEKKQN